MSQIIKRVGLIIALAAVGAFSIPACYVSAEPESAGTSYYNPMYYNGYIVYYDGAGLPIYYVGGAMYYVPSTYVHYHAYRRHYVTHRHHYTRWYGSRGHRYRATGRPQQRRGTAPTRGRRR